MSTIEKQLREEIDWCEEHKDEEVRDLGRLLREGAGAVEAYKSEAASHREALGVLAAKLAAREKRMREVAEELALGAFNENRPGYVALVHSCRSGSFPCRRCELAAKLLEGIEKEDAGT